MIILTVRTDKPEAELGIYDGKRQLAYHKWPAHLKLAETIHLEIKKISAAADISADQLGGIICYKGPGSFTGLRIGLTVANAIAYSYNIPIVAISGQDWIDHGFKSLAAGKNDRIALPKYDRPATTTTPRK